MARFILFITENIVPDLKKIHNDFMSMKFFMRKCMYIGMVDFAVVDFCK